MKRRYIYFAAWKKKFVVLGAMLLLMAVFVPMIRANVRRNRLPEVRYSITIILDAGHGGKDGGATSKSGVIERDLVFDITLLVKDHLRTSGFNVILTRCDENDLASDASSNRKREDLSRRVEILNNAENALAVSIHANSVPSSKWSGAQVFYDAKSFENKELATHIMAAMKTNIASVTREQKPISNIFILRNSQIPTALVEVGFLSNPNEAHLLTTSEYQRQIAYSIFEGILSYVQMMGLDGPLPLEN